MPRLDQSLIDKIIELKDSVNSKMELAQKCGVSRVTVTKYCELLEIDIKVKKVVKRDRRKENGKYLRQFPLKDILDGKYPGYPTSKLKPRLLEAGYKKNNCEECGIEDSWNGKPLSLHIDHINGDNLDHRLNNLRLLCPNCHSQTETFGARNIKRKKERLNL